VKATILSLCDFTGNWSRPYEEANYQVIRVDLQHGQDVRLLRHIAEPIHGILAAPPCTHFARVGARFWEAKGESAILEGLAVIDACLRAVVIYRPTWWVLENPIGRLKDYLGPPKWRFDPWMFGDPWTKRTWLWGHFTPPLPLFAAQARSPVEPVMVGAVGSRDRTSRLSGGDPRRSVTPPGFARAFFEVNP
jgi:hypothetical protein